MSGQRIIFLALLLIFGGMASPAQTHPTPLLGKLMLKRCVHSAMLFILAGCHRSLERRRSKTWRTHPE